jgi:hypothetical protein
VGICDFKHGYQPRTNILMDEKGDLVTDAHSIPVSWKEPFLSAIECIWG